MIKTILKKKKCKKAKWLSEEALQIAEKRREVKGKGEKERYTHWNAEFQRNIYFCFMTMPKPLTVWINNILLKILKEVGIPDHMTFLLGNLYVGQEATVRTGHGTTECCQIGKGVCQGCILSPCLFNLYAEYIMRKRWAGGSTSWNQDCWEKYQ